MTLWKSIHGTWFLSVTFKISLSHIPASHLVFKLNNRNTLYSVKCYRENGKFREGILLSDRCCNSSYHPWYIAFCALIILNQKKIWPNSIFPKIHEAKKDTQYGEQFCSTQVESVQLGKTTDLTFKFLVSPRDRVKCGGGLVWELE